ncbi:hypothetical protein [Nocardia brasiliensis]|uniref:hypothetical protein n=1 Tax=Nocardia brasiliensis TaxID=37326 RepID=UPI00367320AB
MKTDGPETLSKILADSRSGDNMTRVNAIPELGRYVDYRSARERLEEIMLNDEIVTMRVDAAEQLARCGGERGLLAVLNELGRRHNEPDVDYIAYCLYELDASGELPIIDIITAVQGDLSSDGSVGFEDLKRLRGQ